MIDRLFKKWRRHQLFVEPNSGLTQIKDEIEFELHGLFGRLFKFYVYNYLVRIL